jgi:MFS family permease
LRRWLPAALAGLATIGAYGLVLYAFGVLIVPIAEEEGWSSGQLSAAFSIGVLLSGVVALASGQVLDRVGSRPVLLGALAAGSALLWAASFATSAGTFILAWGLGAACVGGGLYYPMTMAVTARLYPAADRARAFSVLTLLGALASPIFYPIAGALVEVMSWRSAIRVLVVLMALLVLPAALALRSAPSRPERGASGSLARAALDPAVWRLFLALALAMAAVNALLLHQVAALREAGLTIAVASALAGLRGFLQIPGRLALAPLVSRVGLFGALHLTYGLCAVGAATLALALVAQAGASLGIVFAIATGIAVGLLSPLHGLIAAEVYGNERLGALSGLQQLVVSAAAGAGAWSAGLLLDATGDYRTSISGVAALLVLALAALTWQRRAPSRRAVAAEVPLEGTAGR